MVHIVRHRSTDIATDDYHKASCTTASQYTAPRQGKTMHHILEGLLAGLLSMMQSSHV